MSRAWASISIARNAAAVSVVKYGLPVPPAKITTRPFSRCRRARRRMYGSAIWCISIADCTRVTSPSFSMMSWRARALMTVASIRMWWAVTSSRHRRAAKSAPRTKFPPPTTMATWTPRVVTSLTSWATRRRTEAARPAWSGPPRASPLSFRRMRRYLGTDASDEMPAPSRTMRLNPGGSGASAGTPSAPGRLLVAEFEPGEPPNQDVLSEFRDRLGKEIAHPLAFVSDEGLLEQYDVSEPLLKTAVHRCLSTTSGGIASRLTYWGAAAVTCRAMSCASRLNSSVRATKSVSQLTSTNAPTRPPACTYASTSPSEASRLAFLSAMANPLARRSSTAFSRSPPACSTAVRQSMTPAPVRARSSLTSSVLLSTVVFRFTCSPLGIFLNKLWGSGGFRGQERIERLVLFPGQSLAFGKGSFLGGLGWAGGPFFHHLTLAPLFQPFQRRVGDPARH